MEKKNSKLFIVVALLLIVGIGTSFAYFLVGVNFKGEGAITNVSTGKLPLVEYDAGSSTLSKDDLTPKDIISKTFKVIVTPTKDIKEATYRIFIDITSNTFVKCMEDNYDEFENACELNAEELVYRLKDSSGTVIKTGNLIGITGQIEIARETKMQDIKTEYSYTIEVEFKDTGKDQNHNTNKIFNASLNVEYAEEVITVDDIIASVNAKTTTPDFSQIADTDEGVFATTDGMYGNTTYYWRGAATTNHVIFANKCWRIVRINGDKTMRLIYNGDVLDNNTCTGNGANSSAVVMGSTDSENYYATSSGDYYNSSYVGWTYSLGSQRTLEGTSSNVKTETEKWYSSNITGTNAEKVAYGKFCNDRNIGTPPSGWNGYTSTWSATGSSFTYAGLKRLFDNYNPTFVCSIEDTYTLKVGAITADEVEFAGGKDETNSLYYLYTGQNYWTMSPASWNSAFATVFIMYSDGYLGNNSVYGTDRGLRPVINLKADITFAKDGLGTLDKPYVCL